MPSRASCTDRSRHCLPPAARDLTPDTPCQMLPWVPWVSFLPNHRLTVDHARDMAHAGRGRWKIENETTNVLTTKGDHLEHNFGPGQQYLAAFLLSLNLLALLVHTVL